MCSSIVPPTSSSISTLTVLCRSGHELEVEPAGVLRGRLDRVVHVELEIGAFAREAAQSAQRDLDVARADLDAVVVVAVAAHLPDLDRRLSALARAADADAFRMRAAVAERRGAAGADPAVAAVVRTVLLLEPLAGTPPSACPSRASRASRSPPGVNARSSTCLNHSSGISFAKSSVVVTPLKYSPKARSNLSNCVSSLTSAARDR